MTSYLVVTTCNANQWEQYGRAMVRTFLRHWPKEVDLRLYPEGFSGAADLHAAAPWLVKFKQRYGSPRYQGGSNRRDYRRDAVRFAHKVAAIGAAAAGLGRHEPGAVPGEPGNSADPDVLIWMDADIVTHSQVTLEWLDSLFPPPATVAWLDRAYSYPECGFLMFRMPEAKLVIDRVVDMYRNGAVFHLPETHDSYVFQHVVNATVARGEAKVHSLSGREGRMHTGHPWVASRLAETMDHLKGEIRKAHGRSLSSDLRQPRVEPYWQ